jgi:hypothetical protein
MWETKLLIACVAVVAAAGQSQAGVVNYDEAVSGDLSPEPAVKLDHLEPMTVFDLGVGKNTVAGTITYKSNPALIWDTDNFAFTVPDGAELVSLTVDTAVIDGNPTYVSWRINTGFEWNNDSSAPESVGVLATPIPGSGDSGVSGLPLSTGDYNLTFRFGGQASIGTPYNSFEYTVTLEVQRIVPEPTSLAIFGFGTLGLVAGGIRRRKKQAA